MSGFKSLWYFFYHRFTARKWDSFHSPFLFKLFIYCCDDRNDFHDFRDIEKRRKELLFSKEKIIRTDYGAGFSGSASSSEKKISAIAEESFSLPFQCRFLYRLMCTYQPVTILELGTSLGITTSYLAKANPDSHIITVEGDPVLASMAQKLFNDQGIKNITSVISTFENFIQRELTEIQSVDFVFFDGNHIGERLNYYYHELLPHFNSQSIVMVDDIYWSEDMHQAWKVIIERPEVTQSVDCFQFGLLFFNRDFLNKEHHKVKLSIKAFRPAKFFNRKQVWHI